MLWRQGDVLIETVSTIPASARKRPGTVLAYGEATGHAHRIETSERAELWEANGWLYLNVLSETRIVHDEHLPITLPVNTYRVWQQREYTPQAILTVCD